MQLTNTALVLEGGAMRGLFTAGVLDVFMEHHITFPACVGVSAGAAFGCNLKSCQNGRVLRYNLAYCKEPKYCSFRSLLKTGNIFGAEFCYHTIPEQLDPFDTKVFAENPMAFYIVATDVTTGKPHYQRLNTVDSDCYEWIRASASMPLVSRIVEVGGGKYLDGGVADSIPLRFMEQQYARNVVVLTRPRDYVKEPASKLWLYKRSLKQYPNMFKAVQTRHWMYNEQRQYVFRQEQAGKAFVICPKEPLNIGRIEHNPQKIQACYDAGKQVAAACIEELKGFLQHDH